MSSSYSKNQEYDTETPLLSKPGFLLAKPALE